MRLNLVKPRKSLPFPLRLKNGAREIKKCKGNFLLGSALTRRAAGLRFGFGSGGSASPLNPFSFSPLAKALAVSDELAI